MHLRSAIASRKSLLLSIAAKLIRYRWLFNRFLLHRSIMSSGSIVIKRIACRPHRADDVRIGALVVDRLPETANVHIDRAQLDIRVAAPDAVEQPLAREDAARVGKEMSQQAKFGRPKVDLLACPPYLVGRGIHLDIAI